MTPRNRRNPKYSCWDMLLPSAAAIAGMVTTAALIAPARAAVLNRWSFDATSRQLTVTLPNGVTPEFFLLAKPARIVLEVPETTLGDVATTQQYAGAVSNIRLTELQGGTRFVLEFAPNTMLDPRHAELTATAVGNGQTEWTLRPLLQGDAMGTVATAPSIPSTDTPSADSVATAPAPSAPAPDANPAPADMIEDAAAPTEAVAPEAETAIADNTSEVTDDSATDADAETTTAIADGTEVENATEDAAADEDATPIVVIPAPDSAAEAVAPSLPDIAESVATGAVQALPSGADELAGVRTDAAALEGVAEDNLTDLPPTQIPIDPFAPGSQAAVSVPSLAEADSTAPPVAVPPLATVPAVPDSAAPLPEAPGAVTAPPSTPAVPPAPVEAPPDAAATPLVADVGLPPSQVRPPGTAPEPSAETPPPVAPTVPATPPVVTEPIAPPPTATIPTPPDIEAAPPAPAVVANSIEIPTIPLPPDSWSDRDDASPAPNQVRPPAPATIAQVPDTSEPAIAPPPATATAIAAPPAPVTPSEGAAPPPPLPQAQTFTPPPATVTAAVPVPTMPAASTTDTDALPPPPFLEDGGAPPVVEQPTIPPPPAAVEGGTVPFGAPLPQTKSLGSSDGSAYGFTSTVPIGTRLPLQYSGFEPLVLAEQEPVYEVLTVVGDVYDPDTGVLLVPMGTQILGRFEGFDESGRRFVTQLVIDGVDRRPLLAESDWIVGRPQPDGTNVAAGASIGAAAVTILTGFTGIGLVGGAAAGAAAGFGESPTLVSIEPGQIIEVEVVEDILPFNDAPDITRQYR